MSVPPGDAVVLSARVMNTTGVTDTTLVVDIEWGAWGVSV